MDNDSENNLITTMHEMAKALVDVSKALEALSERLAAAETEIHRLKVDVGSAEP